VDDHRRNAPRHDVFLPFEIEGRTVSSNDYVADLSVTGAYVRTLEPLPLRTRLHLTITAPKTGRRIAFDGEVMRVIEPEQAPQESLPPGMGIAFLDLGGGDPRPKATEILLELSVLEKERAAAPAPEVAKPKDAADPLVTEGLARLDGFLASARKQNHYEVLGIDAATATSDQVKKHYHRRAKEFHPDRYHRFRTPEIDAKVEEVYGLLTRAYETLRDPAKRDTYDRANGIRETLDFRRAAATGRFQQAMQQAARGRFFSATVGLKVALALDPGNGDIQRKLEEIERTRKFFTT
jgi:hypothetical protein